MALNGAELLLVGRRQGVRRAGWFVLSYVEVFGEFFVPFRPFAVVDL